MAFPLTTTLPPGNWSGNGSWAAWSAPYDPLPTAVSEGLALPFQLWAVVVAANVGACVPLQVAYLLAQRPCEFSDNASTNHPPRSPPLFRAVVPVRWEDGSVIQGALSNGIVAGCLLAIHAVVLMVYKTVSSDDSKRSSRRDYGSAMAAVRFPSLSYSVARMLFVGMLSLGLHTTIHGSVDDVAMGAVIAFAGFSLAGPPAVAGALVGFASKAYSTKLKDAGIKAAGITKWFVSPTVVWFPESVDKRLGAVLQDCRWPPLIASTGFVLWQSLLVALATPAATTKLECAALNGSFAFISGIGGLLVLAFRPWRARFQNGGSGFQALTLAAQAAVCVAGSQSAADFMSSASALLMLCACMTDAMLGSWLWFHAAKWRNAVIATDTAAQLNRALDDFDRAPDGSRAVNGATTKEAIPGLDDHARIDPFSERPEPVGWLVDDGPGAMAPDDAVAAVVHYSEVEQRRGRWASPPPTVRRWDGTRSMEPELSRVGVDWRSLAHTEPPRRIHDDDGETSLAYHSFENTTRLLAPPPQRSAAFFPSRAPTAISPARYSTASPAPPSRASPVRLNVGGPDFAQQQSSSSSSSPRRYQQLHFRDDDMDELL